MRRVLPRLLAGVLAGSMASAVFAESPPSRTQSPPYLRPWLSPAGDVVAPAGLERIQDPNRGWVPRTGIAPARAALPDPRVAGTLIGLSPDVRANDRMPQFGCQNPCVGLPFTQCEPTVAVHGPYVIVGWNDTERNCGPGAGRGQGFAYSTDGGQTFFDAGGVPPGAGTAISGDPVHAVNHKTAQFYVTGLGTGGIGGARGHFSGSSFLFDRNLTVALAGSGEGFDKPWVNVDSLSGNVYFAWADFTEFGPARIEFHRFNANLQPLGPKRVLSDTGVTSCGSQFAQIAVGPAGEVWVSWVQLDCGPGRDRDRKLRKTEEDGLLAEGDLQFLIRKSVDFGATFGPAQLITRYRPNRFNGAPGMQRNFGPYPQSLAVDVTNGPHRGRLYAAWDEPLVYPESGTSDTTSLIESEYNDEQYTANAFVPGGKLRGELPPGDYDWFTFDLRQGETFLMIPDWDSVAAGFSSHLWSEKDGLLTLVARGTEGLMFTSPSDRTYFYEMSASAVPLSYVLNTSILVPDPGSRGRDHRDQFFSWSDDGMQWSEPVRLNDSPPGFDGIYPSVAVDGRGIVHAFWIDFREDLEQGAKSTEYVVSSGDGGVTWGPNRRMGDGPAAIWPIDICPTGTGNTQGDYLHIAADGDRVVAVTNECRLGDPDIFVDASFHHAYTLCNSAMDGVDGRDTVVTAPLVNGGNYARDLSWRIEDSAGWITGAAPAGSGLTTLAIGETLRVDATLHFGDCLGESTLVRFIYSDPAMPGHEDSCVTVVRCTDGTTSALASLRSIEATPEAVAIEWYVPDHVGTPARVWRRAEAGAGVAIGTPESGGGELWRFTDRAVEPGVRYAYRLETPSAEGPSFSTETWVEVPRRVELALAGLRPNPAAGEPVVAFSLATREPARLEAFDLSGRRVFSRDVGSLGPGHHTLRLDSGILRPGLYSLRLTQGSREVRAKAAVVR